MTRILGIAFLLVSTASGVQSGATKPVSDTPVLSSSGGLTSERTVPDSTKLEFIKGEKAVYPAAAKAKKLQGEVWLRLDISETGDVEGVEVLSGDSILAEAAVKAAKTWKFKPFIRDGQPVKVSHKFPFDFAFRQNVKDTSHPAKESSDHGGVEANPANVKVSSGDSPPRGQGGDSKEVQVSQEVAQGLLLHRVQPIYPDDARRNHVQGTVLLRAIIDKSGRISKVEPISGPKELTAAAIGAVEQWRYRPYMLQGAPVDVQTEITVKFELQ
jgi:TonB family protein